MISREARRRFFFIFNSFGMLLICLYVTPTSASAPHVTQAAPVPVSNIIQAKQSAEPIKKANLPAQPVKRAKVQASRDEQRTVIRHGRVKLTERDMELLARLVYAEGRGEPYEGQVAIAAVVLNRVESSQFPNTVREVIFAPNAFSPVLDGHLSSKTNSSARQAVQDAVNGVDPSQGSLYFFNPRTATSRWIWSRPQTVKIGHHIFAS